MKKDDQNILLYQLFHGDPLKGIPSLIDSLLKRERGFSDLFVSDNQLIVTDTAANSPQPLFVLRPDIHLRNERYVLGVDINRQILENATFSSNSKKFSKRQLRRCATECLKTIKIANSFAITLVDGEGNSKKIQPIKRRRRT
jgi:hypothetical protein